MALGGFEPPQPTDRLFFAVFPDATAAATVADIAQTLRNQQHLQGKPLLSDRFHVTLHHLGDYAGLPQDVVARAGQAAVAVDMPAFEVAFDSAASFSGHSRHHPFVLRGDDGVVAVQELQRSLGACMASVGLGRLVKPAFTPHVTLLYDERVVAMQTIDRIAWIAREFVLVHSLLGKTKHLVLGRWPLRSR